jgi:large subunit ribosomal protein L25
MTFSLNVETRTEHGKDLVQMRKEGKLPAIMYGPKEEAVSLTIDRIAFEKLFKQTGESSVITLSGLGTPKDVIVHEIAFDARRGGMIHVDFYAVEAGKEITVSVPLEFIGEAPATKHGGTLTKVLHEVEVTALPSNLPKEITVDVSMLDDFEKQIHISDLVIPAGITLEHEQDEVVALVQAVDEEEETEGAIDMGAIEVEKKGKAETAE